MMERLKNKCGNSSRTRFVQRLIVALFLFLAAGQAGAVNLLLDDVNPAQMPAVGSYGLRILSPTLLEITYVTEKQPDPAPLSEWNFVDASFNFAPPALSEFNVTIGTQSVPVQKIGFKRRPLYAPLKKRDLRIANYLYLQLPNPVADGVTVQVTNPSGKLWTSDKQFSATMSPMRLNPAIHVNQHGYMPNFTKKAMIGYYLGDLGEMNISSSLAFKIVDLNGTVFFQGPLTLRRDIGYSYSPLPYQQVLEADFSAFNTPGEYRLQVPGLGTSYQFHINDGIAAAFARTYALGLYHQRCGFSNEMPFTRHTRGACHTNLVEIPDMSFSAANAELANMTSSANPRQTAPRLNSVDASLYPFVNRTPIEMSGGHHDAGDYSKYTINVAQLLHSLVFAADAFPGAGALDNLGLPESGDGKSDLLQEAKWEADFLGKLQDGDGGFYFLVYPRNREYEDDVTPDHGDSQIVFPKTTSVTAAAVAALAQTASSPLFKQTYPEAAATYLAKAKKGWSFLTNAFARFGRDGSYQKITHYGDEFMHDDELAWAATELYLATGESAYHNDLLTHFDPSNPNTMRWGWWKMFEGYGCAIRSYAFAVRTGRVPAGSLDATHLAKCEAQIRTAGDDQTRFSQEMAYGSSFPDPNKPYRSAGWYFSVDQTFDIATAYQLDPKPEYIDAILANMNYEAGCNPLNMGFLTGIGWRRQHETVNQYAENDRRILPPSGIPLGSVQQGCPYIYPYKSELSALCFPADGATTAPYAPYDKWCDTFNTSTEFVNPQQGHSLASMAFMMALTPLKTQAWVAATGQISGLPASVPAHNGLIASLSADGLDLSKARVIWETGDQEPFNTPRLRFAAANVGPQWLEAEALLPDGRRVFAATNYLATFPLDVAPNVYQSVEQLPDTGTVALYHANGDGSDAAGRQPALTLLGNAALDSSNLGWMATRSGSAIHFLDLGDRAIVTIPNESLANNAQTITVEAMIYINQYKGYNRANALLVSLRRNDWNALLELDEDMYAGPTLRGGAQWTVPAQIVNPALTTKQWHHLQLSLNPSGYSMRVDGKLVASLSSAEFANWSGSGATVLELGNFDGWVDEVAVKNGSVIAAAIAADMPAISPNGGTFSSAVPVTLTTTTADAIIRYTTDGTAPSVASPLYVSPISLATTATIKACAFKVGMTQSTVSSAEIVINSTPATTNVTPGTVALFVKSDSASQGTWNGVYGADGYNVIGHSALNPSYAQITPQNQNEYTWSASTTDARALLKPGSPVDRVAAAWYSATNFSVNLNFPDGKSHQVAFYCLDWDNGGRAQVIDVLDAGTGALLSSQTLSAFSSGKYLVWRMSGNVIVRFTRTSGSNALLTGMFFDPTPSLGGLQTTVTRPSQPGVSQLKLSGQIGQSFVIMATTNLQTWEPISTNTLSSTTFDFVDTNAANFPSRFYRAIPVQ